MHKKLILIVLMVFLSYFICNAQFWKSENNFERDVIIVFGSAETEVAADVATFKFDVIGYAKDLNSAVENARNKVDLISKELFKIGLDKNNLTTSQFKSSENKGDKAFLSSKKDYRALMKVQVTVDSISLLEPVLTAVSLMNPDYISDITFSLKDIETVKMNTVKLAVEKADKKAMSICEMLKINLGSPIYIEEIQENKNNQLMYSNTIVSLQAGVVDNSTVQVSSIFVETIKVNASVRAIYSIDSNINK